jgi:peptide/nickel transport system substrate-binding protein
MRRTAWFVALGILSVALIGASASSAGRSASGALVWAWNFAPTAAWAVETDDASYITQAGVAEPLVRVAVNGQVGPGLATSWKQTSPLVWRFNLRRGVTFQNGQPFNAAAVVNSLNYVLHVKVPAAALSPQDIVSVKAAGPAAVIVQTAAPNALVPQELSTASAIILARKAYLANGNINPVGTGTGPFIMTASNLPQSISLKANPHYWGGKVGLPSAQVRYIPDGQTRVSLARTGEAQLASSLPADQLPTLTSDPNLVVMAQAIPRFTGLYLNNKRAPFTDVRVRQAIQSALDVKAIAATVGGARAATGAFIASEPWAPKPAKAVPYNLAHAQALLSAAGVDPSKLSLELLAYSDRADLPIAATVIQNMLGKLGIKVTIKVATYNALEPDMLSGNYDMALVSRNYEFYDPDPLSFLFSDYTCKGTYNISQFCDPKVDALVKRAQAIVDSAKRYVVYAQIAKMLQTNAVDVFLYNPLEIEARSKALKGFSIYTTEEYYLTPQLRLAP